MIKEFELYHGAVLSKLAHGRDRDVTIQPYPTPSRSSYVINGNIGLYIKHSSNRMTPWSFSFADSHQEEILAMHKKLENVFIALVCGTDGIACLSFDELKYVLDDEHGKSEWVKASRKPREKYAIKGSDGKLRFKIADNSFPLKLFTKPEKKSFFDKFG